MDVTKFMAWGSSTSTWLPDFIRWRDVYIVYQHDYQLFCSISYHGLIEEDKCSSLDVLRKSFKTVRLLPYR